MELKKVVSIYHPDGFSGKIHTHRYHEMVYCVEGRGTVNINGKRSAFSTGNYYITERDTPHSEIDNGASRIIFFYFDAPISDVKEGAYTDYRGNILNVVNRLNREYENNFIHKELMLRTLLMEVLLETERNAVSNNDERNMESVFKYIDENSTQRIDFKQLAEQHHYSYDRFRHIFKEHSGFSPYQYVINKRIEKAKFLLKFGANESVTDVAFNCGFDSSSQFTNIFRSREGMTPSEYKKQMQKSE